MRKKEKQTWEIRNFLIIAVFIVLFSLSFSFASALEGENKDMKYRYQSKDDVPSVVNLFGGWMQVGSNYVTDLWGVDFYELLAGCRGKVLLLHGDRDHTVPLSYSEKAAEIIPDCEFHVIKDGGHEFFGQPFEDAMSLILKYLEELPAAQKNSGEESMDGLTMKIGETPVSVEWENNESVDALKVLTGETPLTIQMSMYGGFEQVGPIGQSLPRNDGQTVTNSGDIVLYSGNQIVVFYGSNSWAYTRLGHISDKSAREMADLLGNGNVTITIGR